MGIKEGKQWQRRSSELTVREKERKKKRQTEGSIEEWHGERR